MFECPTMRWALPRFRFTADPWTRQRRPRRSAAPEPPTNPRFFLVILPREVAFAKRLRETCFYAVVRFSNIHDAHALLPFALASLRLWIGAPRTPLYDLRERTSFIGVNFRNSTPEPTVQQSSAAPVSSAPPAETNTPVPTTLITSQQSTPAPVASTSQAAAPTTQQQSQPAETTTSQQTQAPTTSPERGQTTVVGTTIVVTPTQPGGQTSTIITYITQTQASPQDPSSVSSSATASSTSSSGSGSGSGGGLGNGGTIAVAVVVPIAAVALLILAGLYFWRKRKQRKHAEEERRKEVEDYAYNPNADPTIPSLGDGGSYEMKEDGSAGYRGWGTTTLAGSTGRKASTTMSGGNTGEPLINDGSYSPDGEILGAMGPSAALNRGAGVQRGPSNASSSYSAGNRSDTSDGGIGMAYSGGNPYDQYGNNPYSENSYGDRPTELPGQPVIRDNPARRNTRIENPSHYPQQQNAGISQNF
ncbi:putative serine-rich protein [Colletotrichum orbiculare MAFF 240422]|uniref:Serine-rich protein n=1 Tax=Colletotrichum orbiculare (strain 104-T / ATCC 96160 / CBS 514.97 / LARS 414 / MAFF 240422) TaxID=1213857 RepID=A0A484FZG2_COLOR|nr:putative serine-rich protein [Colletotrichum orbiculare MAFF 240422]